MKTLLNRIKTWIVWLFDNRVRAAVNNGASYNEVEQLVNDIVAKGGN